MITGHTLVNRNVFWSTGASTTNSRTKARAASGSRRATIIVTARRSPSCSSATMCAVLRVITV